MARRRKSQKQPSKEFVQQLAEGIGRAIIAASQIEYKVSDVISTLFRFNRLQHRALVLPMSITNKITILQRLGKEYLSKDEQKTLKNILSEVRACADKRNDLAHGFYGAKAGKFALITYSGEAKLVGQPVSWSPTSLNGLLIRMTALRDEVDSIRALFPARLKVPKNRQPIDSSANE